jgi:hypothetical protein
MRDKVCATVDVEDFYAGMEVLGVPVRGVHRAGDKLASLVESLEAHPSKPKITLYVVGNYADRVRSGLALCAASGHEIASHGPDHGRLPSKGLVEWLRRGREMLEQLLQVPVGGFRSPRFDVPDTGLAGYREALAEAGYLYVSDATRLGPGSPVCELPVLRWAGIPIGGGSYQRFLPRTMVRRGLAHTRGPAVLYYHSYDFDGSLPPLRTVRSTALVRQLVARARIRDEFRSLLARYGSCTCAEAAR